LLWGKEEEKKKKRGGGGREARDPEKKARFRHSRERVAVRGTARLSLHRFPARSYLCVSLVSLLVSGGGHLVFPTPDPTSARTPTVGMFFLSPARPPLKRREAKKKRAHLGRTMSKCVKKQMECAVFLSQHVEYTEDNHFLFVCVYKKDKQKVGNTGTHNTSAADTNYALPSPLRSSASSQPPRRRPHRWAVCSWRLYCCWCCWSTTIGPRRRTTTTTKPASAWRTRTTPTTAICW